MTTSWKTICCAVDPSEPARAAFDAAVDLSRRLGSELVLLHVDAAERLAAELGSDEPPDAQLAAWAEEARRTGVARVRVERVRGQPEAAIVEFARAGRVDLIVIGTHGRTDREKMLTGSVAELVVRNAACPVLAVHSAPAP